MHSIDYCICPRSEGAFELANLILMIASLRGQIVDKLTVKCREHRKVLFFVGRRDKAAYGKPQPEAWPTFLATYRFPSPQYRDNKHCVECEVVMEKYMYMYALRLERIR